MDGDYAGLPLNAAGRWRAQSWSPENVEVPEWVCRPHAWDFSLEAGASQLRLWAEIDNPTQDLIALRGRLSMREQEATIWMDARPRPPDYALHTWSGFSTGEWDGDTLIQTATHLKEAYIRRWGPMRSDQATVRIRWKRIGDYLRATVIIYDPVYLAEPYIRTSLFWVSDPALVMPPYPCEGPRDGRRARHGATLPPGKNLLPRRIPGHDRSGRPTKPGWAAGDDVSRVHRQDETFPRPVSPRRPRQRSVSHEVPAGVWIVGVVALGAWVRRAVATQDAWLEAAIPTGSDGQTTSCQSCGNVYMIVGAGGNITVHAGPEGVLLVDTACRR